MSGFFSVWIDAGSLDDKDVATAIVNYLWKTANAEKLAKAVVSDNDFEENREDIEAFVAALQKELEASK